jgi:quinol monooxygenase YgiN
MWAQMISVRMKPGHENDLEQLVEQLRSIEQPGSGLIRSLAMRDQNDPSMLRMFVLFESEEAARARESDERRQAGLQQARATMTAMFDGAPEFLDLNVVEEFAP